MCHSEDVPGLLNGSDQYKTEVIRHDLVIRALQSQLSQPRNPHSIL